MIKAAIFDVDGVIVESEPLASLAYESLFRFYGVEPTYNERGLVFDAGTREKDVLEKFRNEHNIDDSVEVLMAKRNELYNELLKNLVPRPGITQLLELLKKHDLRIGIASSGVSHRINTKLKLINLLEYFEHITAGDHVERGKPFPDVFLESAKQLQVDPKDCVVFEDSENGVIAAAEAGMKIIAIPTRYTKAHDFSKATLVVNSLENITWRTIEGLDNPTHSQQE